MTQRLSSRRKQSSSVIDLLTRTLLQDDSLYLSSDESSEDDDDDRSAGEETTIEELMDEAKRVIRKSRTEQSTLEFKRKRVAQHSDERLDYSKKVRDVSSRNSRESDLLRDVLEEAKTATVRHFPVRMHERSSVYTHAYLDTDLSQTSLVVPDDGDDDEEEEGDTEQPPSSTTKNKQLLPGKFLRDFAARRKLSKRTHSDLYSEAPSDEDGSVISAGLIVESNGSIELSEGGTAWQADAAAAVLPVAYASPTPSLVSATDDESSIHDDELEVIFQQLEKEHEAASKKNGEEKVQPYFFFEKQVESNYTPCVDEPTMGTVNSLKEVISLESSNEAEGVAVSLESRTPREETPKAVLATRVEAAAEQGAGEEVILEPPNHLENASTEADATQNATTDEVNALPDVRVEEAAESGFGREIILEALSHEKETAATAVIPAINSTRSRVQDPAESDSCKEVILEPPSDQEMTPLPPPPPITSPTTTTCTVEEGAEKSTSVAAVAVVDDAALFETGAEQGNASKLPLNCKQKLRGKFFRHFVARQKMKRTDAAVTDAAVTEIAAMPAETKSPGAEAKKEATATRGTVKSPFAVGRYRIKRSAVTALPAAASDTTSATKTTLVQKVVATPLFGNRARFKKHAAAVATTGTAATPTTTGTAVTEESSSPLMDQEGGNVGELCVLEQSDTTATTTTNEERPKQELPKEERPNEDLPTLFAPEDEEDEDDDISAPGFEASPPPARRSAPLYFGCVACTGTSCVPR